MTLNRKKSRSANTAAYCLAMFAFLLPLGIGYAQDAIAPKKKEQPTMVRMLCVQTLSRDEEEVTLATRTEEGKWKEYGNSTLRSPFISDWMPVPSGVCHVVRKKGDEVVSLGSFTIKEGLKRAILIMLPDVKKNIYSFQVILPDKLVFQKGTALILNYGKVPAVVKIGKASQLVAPGKQVVQKINANGDGMYRLLIGHMGTDKKIVACYDRFLSSNPNTRKFILLFPDPDTGLRAMSLSEFGPFE